MLNGKRYQLPQLATTIMSLAAFAALATTTQATAAGPEKGEAFTTTTTHVELNSLGQFFKIEFAQPETKPARETKKPKERGPGSFFLDILGLVELDARVMKQDEQPAFVRLGIIRYSLFAYYGLNEEEKLKDEYMSANLFALLDFVAERGDMKTPMGSESRFARAVILDSPILTVWRVVYQSPQRVEWEALDLPLVTTLWHVSDTNENRWKFLNIPFLWMYRYEREGDSTETHLVDGPGIALFRREQHGDDRDEWDLFHALAIDGFKGRQEGETSHYGVLESFSLFNGPLLALYNSDVEKDSRSGSDRQTEKDAASIVSSKQIARLPFLGPLIGAWRDDRGGHFAVLPNLFIKSRNRPEAFQWF